jgi:hypothetical protein
MQMLKLQLSKVKSEQEAAESTISSLEITLEEKQELVASLEQDLLSSAERAPAAAGGEAESLERTIPCCTCRESTPTITDSSGLSVIDEIQHSRMYRPGAILCLDTCPDPYVAVAIAAGLLATHQPRPGASHFS